MKKVEVGLDDKSLEILDKLDPVHKQSIINFGIRLARDTDFYKILVGNEEVKIENINDIKKQEEPKKMQKEIEKKDDVLDLGDFI